MKYTLTHSKYHVAAAAITDGGDMGYVEYMLFGYKSAFEATMGVAPFGMGLDRWIHEAPGFLLDRVRTPIWLESHGMYAVLAQWEWYAGLRRLGKPVDFFVLPAAEHVLVKPWERMASSQHLVDWFKFWLLGEEDHDPAKAEQYARWRQFRVMQDSSTAKTAAAQGR